MKKNLLSYLLWFSIVLALTGLALIAFGGDWRLWGLGGLLGGILGALTYTVLNYAEVRGFLFEYGTRQWLSLILFVLLLMGVVVLIQAIANRHNVRFDLTPRKDMSLTAASEKIMETISTPVLATAFFQRNQKREMMNILEPFSLASRHFTYNLYDPDRNPALAKRFGVNNYGMVVVEMGGKYKVLPAASEESIVNAILSLSNPQQKVVYFLTGHGEHVLKEPDNMDGSSSELLKTTLETENYAVRTLLLLTSRQVPDDAALVIINGPHENLAPGELSALEAYLNQGGNIILTVDPGPDYGLAALLGTFDLKLGNDIIVDPVNNLMAKGPLVPIIQTYLNHTITDKFTIPTVLPMTRSVLKGEANLPGVTVTTIALTSDRSWAESSIADAEKGDFRYDTGRDWKGPVAVAAVVEGSVETNRNKIQAEPFKGHLVVFGSSEFITNQYITLAGNRDLFMNAVRYLTEDKPLIVIKKSLTASDKAPLILPPVQARMVFIGVVILQPALIIAIGIVVAWRRRQKS
ncbi:MAG: GldG family protein [Syntrophaceae bacterium]|nr:GldG family protein [Syntrophaceae bacterium]